MEQAKAHIRVLNLVILVAFGGVALTLAFWSTVRAPWLSAREDNLRLIEAGLRTQRGTIFDTNGVPLAESIGDGRVTRSYHPASGPAVGYYSFRYGAAGVEQAFDRLLSGSDGGVVNVLQRDFLHEPQAGRDLRLTIDSRWQQGADRILVEQRGALVLLSLPDLAVRAMASYPTYDATMLDEKFEELVEAEDAPLLNRATQGQFQPGMVLQPFVMASGLQRGWFQMDNLVASSGELELDGYDAVCQGENSAENNPTIWQDVLTQVCPGYMNELAYLTDSAELEALLAEYGFMSAPKLPLVTEVATPPYINDFRRAIIGQDALTLSPMQVALAWSGLVDEGSLRPARLIAAIETFDGGWDVQLPPAGTTSMVAPSVAATLVDALPRHANRIEHRALALAGPEGSTTAWYLALVPQERPRFALVVVVENSDLEKVTGIGRSYLDSVLALEQ
ncbi:MAG: penicillin-binding transpeptidase domain-containing protein [Candidatus Promineifilaceae bacterium]